MRPYWSMSGVRCQHSVTGNLLRVTGRVASLSARRPPSLPVVVAMYDQSSRGSPFGLATQAIGGSHPPSQSTASKVPEATPMGFVVPRIGRRRLLSLAPVEGCHRAETTAFSRDMPVQDLTLRRAGRRSVWCAVRRTRGARCRTRTVSHHSRRATKRTDLRRRGSDM